MANFGSVGKWLNSIGSARALTQLHDDIPLAYCLMRDRRTPMLPKAKFAAKIGVMAGSSFIPFVGEIELYTLAPQIIGMFAKFVGSVEKVNPALVAEHRRAVANKTSVWHEDLEAGRDLGENFGRDLGEAAEAAAESVGRAAQSAGDTVGRAAESARDAVKRWTGWGRSLD